MNDRPELPSRTRRLVAFVRHNRDRIVVDAAVLLAWIIVTTMIFDWLRLPIWLHYLVLFVGILVYSQVTPNWERPYRSPD